MDKEYLFESHGNKEAFWDKIHQLYSKHYSCVPKQH